jgi:DNA-binding transcriptional MerR regulator
MTYSISDLAEEFGVTTRTIRFYEEKGLLNPTREGQRRIYGPADRTRLRLILRGKRLGFSLEESADIIRMYGTPGSNQRQLRALLERIRARREILLQQQSDLEALLRELDAAEGKALGALDALDALDGTPTRAAGGGRNT